MDRALSARCSVPVVSKNHITNLGPAANKRLERTGLESFFVKLSDGS
jgi:hypothetical protein